ncbi:hypothetical protein L596_002370 [Steinernema carpocapsae]|uniref:glutathione transferase n=1 Tax=Steinernema carpocapsae TaxID=34508 RepID=A0A4V6I7P3_STECR|nr:hypothetical protein L596_002370 [Steinernema carpocapsae]
MRTYKLTYFGGRGLGEAARMLFAFNNVPFEDVKIEEEEWIALKPKTPFGQVPVLEVDGVELAQSFAIYRYLANEFGLAGTTPMERAQVDSVADAYKDFAFTVLKYVLVNFGFAEGDAAALHTEVVVPEAARYLPSIVKVLERSGSGFCVKSGITWADMYIAGQLYTLRQLNTETLKDYPQLEKLIENVMKHPKLEKYVKEWL